MHHLCGWGGKLPRNSMRAPSGKNGSNGCFSVFTVHFSVHQVLTSHFSVQALTSQFSRPTSHVPLLPSHFSYPTSHVPLLTSHFSRPTSPVPLLSSLDPHLIHIPNLQHFLRTSLIKAGGFKPGMRLGVQKCYSLTAKTPLFCSYPAGYLYL